jgi:hypothetical protein
MGSNGSGFVLIGFSANSQSFSEVSAGSPSRHGICCILCSVTGLPVNHAGDALSRVDLWGAPTAQFALHVWLHLDRFIADDLGLACPRRGREGWPRRTGRWIGPRTLSGFATAAPSSRAYSPPRGPFTRFRVPLLACRLPLDSPQLSAPPTCCAYRACPPLPIWRTSGACTGLGLRTRRLQVQLLPRVLAPPSQGGFFSFVARQAACSPGR